MRGVFFGEHCGVSVLFVQRAQQPQANFLSFITGSFSEMNQMQNDPEKLGTKPSRTTARDGEVPSVLVSAGSL